MSPLLKLVIFGTLGVWFLAVLYWQIVIAEGAYLGQRVVTWLYDITANRYDSIKQFRPKMEAAFLGKPLADKLKTLNRPLVLDVATGTGRLPVTLFHEALFDGHVIGVDDSLPMLKIAADKLGQYEHRIMLLWRDARRLPFADDTFDAVTCLEMLEFTPFPEGQLAEVVRVLRPGGVLLTTQRRGLNATLMPGKTRTKIEFEVLLEELNIEEIAIQPWQVEYNLVWGVKCGSRPSILQHPLDVLCCPVCHSTEWSRTRSLLMCKHCGDEHQIEKGVTHYHE